MKNYEFVVWLEGYLNLCPNDRLGTIRQSREFDIHRRVKRDSSALRR
jgi:hypothetical protein